MIERRRKIRIFQLGLFSFGILALVYTYYNFDKNIKNQDTFIKSEIKEKLNSRIQNTKKDNSAGDIFYNIQYSGLDLQGNRYILKSKEAFTEKNNQELVKMKDVVANFYFKDNTGLVINSQNGTYNNKTLNMTFEENVEAQYQENKLNANKAEYINSENILVITGNVKVASQNGDLVADKLFFDVKNQELKISSLKNNKINVNISNK